MTFRIQLATKPGAEGEMKAKYAKLNDEVAAKLRKHQGSRGCEQDIMNNVVLVNPYCFKEIFHRRSVNNIYFDDQNMSFYRQNVAGDANREKYRLRWYGDDFVKVSNPTFEIKKKFKTPHKKCKTIKKGIPSIKEMVTKQPYNNSFVLGEALCMDKM